MKFARTMWIYDNVRRGSSLLDLGCGEGLLALLKRKDVYLAGLDLSPDLVAMAHAQRLRRSVRGPTDGAAVCGCFV